MDCSQSTSLFNAYLDGELTGSLAAEFAAHKLQCAACRRELALLEVVGHVVANDTEVPQLDEAFTDRLVACALEPAHQPRRWRKRSWFIGGPLAAAASIALVLYIARPEPRPVVLSDIDRIDSAEEMLRQVKEVRRTHPESVELKALEDALQERLNRFASGTEEGRELLENFGKMTIMEILDSIQLDRSRAEPQAPAPANTSGVDHASPVADL